MRPGGGCATWVARREELITANIGQVQQIRDLLECVWPAALETAQQPFRSQTWAAAMAGITDRDGGELERTRRLGWTRFERAVRRKVTRRAGQRLALRIVRNLFAALRDRAGVIAHRRGALERVAPGNPTSLVRSRMDRDVLDHVRLPSGSLPPAMRVDNRALSAARPSPHEEGSVDRVDVRPSRGRAGARRPARTRAPR
jgi:hypothetical protein